MNAKLGPRSRADTSALNKQKEPSTGCTKHQHPGFKKKYIREAQCRVRVISDDDLGLPGLREKYK